MILTQAKTVRIGTVEFPNVKWRSRIVFEYENMTGEPYSDIGKKTEEQFKLFYCAAKIGSILAKKPFDYTYDQFLDITDDYFNETISQFVQALYTSEGGDKKKPKTKT